MDTTVAVHRAASALAVVLIAMALMARDDPEMAGVLAMVLADPMTLATFLIMTALTTGQVR